MGKGKRAQPRLLPAKLGFVRHHLGFTQEEMVKWAVPATENAASDRAAISDYESGRRFPSPLEVFHYAKAVRDLTVHKDFSSDDLIDDTRELPFSLTDKNAGIADAPPGELAARRKKRKADQSSENSILTAESDDAGYSARDSSGNNSLSISAASKRQLSENSAAGSSDDATVENAYEGEKEKADHPRRFFFSREFLDNFDDFMMRLLLAAPHRFREHYSDSSLSIEIAVMSALRDLERRDRENASSVVIECLHEHIADHYDN